jgi:hypothetical protein
MPTPPQWIVKPPINLWWLWCFTVYKDIDWYYIVSLFTQNKKLSPCYSTLNIYDLSGIFLFHVRYENIIWLIWRRDNMHESTVLITYNRSQSTSQELCTLATKICMINASYGGLQLRKRFGRYLHQDMGQQSIMWHLQNGQWPHQEITLRHWTEISHQDRFSLRGTG